MTTQEDIHAPAPSSEAAPPPSLEDAPPLLLECEPTLLFDGEPTLLLEPAPQTPPLEATPLPVEAAPTPSPKPAARPAVAPKANAPDPFAVGVRLLRMAPAWLLFVTVLCGALVMVLGWVRGDGDAATARLSRRQNDALSVKTTPKPDAPAPKTAAANSPEVAASAPAAAPVQAPPPVEVAPAQVQAPAPAEQPAAPKPVEPAKAEQPAPTDNAGAKFTVQVGSYNNQSEANGHVSRLRAAGFESRSASVELPGRGTWYRVLVGRFAERAEASKTVAQLRVKGAASGALVAPLQ